MMGDLGGLSAGRLAVPEASSSSGGGSTGTFNALLITASFFSELVRNAFGQQGTFCSSFVYLVFIYLFSTFNL